MVKGFTRDGKFHPTTSSSGAKRKKRIESKDMLSPTGGVKMHLSKRTEGVRLKRDHGIPEKRSGLNKVTIMEFHERMVDGKFHLLHYCITLEMPSIRFLINLHLLHLQLN